MIRPTKKVKSAYYKNTLKNNNPEALDVCTKWRQFRDFILIERHPTASLGTYRRNLFDLSRTDCANNWSIRGKSYLSIITDKEVSDSVFSKEEYRINPYDGLISEIKKIENQEWKKENKNNEDGLLCRKINPAGKYCDTQAGSLTVNRRAAGWGCGIGMLVGLDQVGQCNQYFDYDGLKEDLEDIQYIMEEFESLSYLCAGQIISATQCKLLENFSTQHQIYKDLLEKKKKLLNYKLYPIQLRITAVLLITIFIFLFLVNVKTFT